MSVHKPKVDAEGMSEKFPSVSGQNVSPIAPLDDHDPEDRYGSYDGHVGGEPLKGGRSSGIIGKTRQRTGSAQSDKNPRSVGRQARRRTAGQ